MTIGTICVVGLLDRQAKEFERAVQLPEGIRLRFVSSQRAKLGTVAIRQADTFVIMTRFVAHQIVERIRRRFRTAHMCYANTGREELERVVREEAARLVATAPTRNKEVP